MLERSLRFSIEHRGGVIIAVVVAALIGLQSLTRLPIDAVPDVTNQQVQLTALAPSLSPVEVERQVTFVIETALAGVPGLEYTRSFSRNGFAQMTAGFADDVDMYFARQQVGERLNGFAQMSAFFPDDVDIYFARQQVGERLNGIRLQLPADCETVLGPISSGLGEIYMWTVEYADDAPSTDGAAGPQTDGSYRTPEGAILRSNLERAAYLRTLQDWIITPQIKTVRGVAGVDTIGGYVKQYNVEPDPQALAAFGLTFHELITALERNNLNTGAGYVEYNGESYVVRANGRLTDPADLGTIVVAERQGVPVRVRDLATVGLGRELRTGSASQHGEEVVVGTALMLLGANSRTVSAAVDARMADVGASLPPGVRAKTVLDRSLLVEATIDTVQRNLLEGALLVVVALFLMLGNFRAALITALAIPLSMLLAAIGMVQTRTSGNLMSLGAIDFGLIVDGSVIIVENCVRRLAERQRELGRTLSVRERCDVVFDASKQVRSATAFGEAIIITVYIPVLALTGIEGKMFEPMARTVIFALTAAFVLSLTFVPAMVAIFLTGRVRERENPVVAWLKRIYAPALRAALQWRTAVLVVAAGLFGGALLLFRTLGQEFAPTLSELDILVHAFRIPSTSLTQATEMQGVLERRIEQFPEVAFVFSRTGTSEVAGDMPPYVSDTVVILRPRDEWPDPGMTKADVQVQLMEALHAIPGNAYEFTQPIEMRFNELLAGVRADVAVKVFGEDFDQMLPIAERIAAILGDVPGAADLSVEQVTGAPVLSIEVDRDAMARYALSVADVHEVVQIGVGGRQAGQIFEGDRRFDVVVRLAEDYRGDPVTLENLPIPLPHAHKPPTPVTLGGDDIQRAELRYLPLSSVARVHVTEGPNQISRENGKRRIVVQSNVRGRDLGSFVAEAQARVAEEIALPTGSWITWGGQYENLVRARARLAIVVPICFLVILMLLYSTFGSLRPAAMVFTGVPLALTGGIVSLWLRDMPFSISAAVGFIALSGVAVLNGLVMITFINQLRATGQPAREAILEGAVVRLRPVLMTALVASLGFVPMALATGTGAEVQRPLATVVIGGLITSTVLTLFVLPVLYDLFAGPDRTG